MDLGPHAGFIWAAYGVVAVVLAALVTWLVLDGRRQQPVSYTHLTLPTN